MSIIDELRAYLERGANVCPFSKMPSHVYTDELGAALELPRFARTPNARESLIVVASGDPRTFEGGRRWARTGFISLALGCRIVMGIPRVDAYKYAARAQAAFDGLVTNEAGQVMNMFLDVWGHPIVTIAMLPAYPKGHPRYAPHACLVLTWSRVVSEQIGTELGKGIRDRAFAAHGATYDADEVVLPLPKAK